MCHFANIVADQREQINALAEHAAGLLQRDKCRTRYNSFYLFDDDTFVLRLVAAPHDEPGALNTAIYH